MAGSPGVDAKRLVIFCKGPHGVLRQVGTFWCTSSHTDVPSDGLLINHHGRSLKEKVSIIILPSVLSIFTCLISSSGEIIESPTGDSSVGGILHR